MTANSVSQRIVSIDFLRGFTIAAMILVNNPGSWSHVFPPLSHASWHGCTPTDLVFPMFLFLVGFSVVLSLNTSKNNPVKKPILKKIAIRTLKLFALGLFLNAFPFFELHELRIMGVLQRIAIVFLISSVLFLYVDFNKIAIVSALILIFYYVLMVFVPFPERGTDPLNTNNMAAYLDGFVLKGHMWKMSKTWDPEGLFSTLPAIVSGLIGVLNGMLFLKMKNKQPSYLRTVLIWGICSIVAGYVWSFFFPLNKSLWTSSFVLFTSGICMLIFLLVFYLLDINKKDLGNKIFISLGSNAIVAYFLSEITANLSYNISVGNDSLKNWLFVNLFNSWLPALSASLVMALCWVAICYVPIHFMYKKRIFVKI